MVTRGRHVRLSSLLLVVMVLCSTSLFIPCIHAKEEESCMSMAEDGGEGSCKASNASTNSDGGTTNVESSAATTLDNEPKVTCEDQHEKCQMWADVGECTANPSYMNKNCQRACELCADQL